MAISKEDVEHVAQLARLEINEADLPKLTQEMGAILDFVDELNLTSTPDVAVVSQISGLKNIARDDQVVESFSHEKMLANAPEQKDGFIKVPKVFE